MSKNTNKRSVLQGPFSRNSVTTLLGISDTLFDRLRRDGAPVGEASDGNLEVHLPSFIRFMIEDAVRKSKGSVGDGPDYDEAKARDKAFQAETRELQLNKLKGILVEVEDVRPAVREVFGIVRSRLLSVPSQITGMTIDQQRQLQDAVNDALTDLSSDRFEIRTDDAITATA